MTPIPSISAILQTAADHHGVDVDQLLHSRHATPTRARQLAAAMLRHRHMSYPEIARALGWRSHSTAIDAERQADRELAESLVAELRRGLMDLPAGDGDRRHWSAADVSELLNRASSVSE